MRRTARLFAAALVGGTLLGGITAPASAHPPSPPSTPTPVAEDLQSPLSLAVGDRSLYVAQSSAGLLTRIGRDGERTDLVSRPGSEVAGLSLSHRSLTYALNTGEPGGEVAPTALIQRLDHRGRVRTLADLAQYEEAKNPDGGVLYGWQGIAEECAAQIDPEMFGPVTHYGEVYSHPYATVTLRDGTAVVADAGANAIFTVSQRGRVRTLAVLPPAPTVATAEIVAGLGLPECATGLTYLDEPVPTDVELGRDGKLYVTTLPGGPESPLLGARGAVHRLDPRSGKLSHVADGLFTATGLAVTPRGDIYVTELFGNQVSVIRRGSSTPTPFLELAQPSAIEWSDGRLYISSGGLGGPGSVVKVGVR